MILRVFYVLLYYFVYQLSNLYVFCCISVIKFINVNIIKVLEISQENECGSPTRVPRRLHESVNPEQVGRSQARILSSHPYYFSIKTILFVYFILDLKKGSHTNNIHTSFIQPLVRHSYRLITVARREF